MSKTLIWLLAILGAVVIGGGGFMAGKWYAEKYQPTATTTTASSTTTVAKKTTATTAVSEYAGWKTYKNTEIGYQLKYPADWTVKEIDEVSETIGEPVKYITITTADKKYFLHWGVKKTTMAFNLTDRTGVGAGEFNEVPTKALTILGIKVVPQTLGSGGKIREVWYNPAANTTASCQCEFMATLSYGEGADYDTVDLNDDPLVWKNAEKILKSVGWL